MTEIENEMILAIRDNLGKQSDLISNQLDHFQNNFDKFINENRNKNLDVLEKTELGFKELIQDTKKQFKRNTLLTKILLGGNALFLGIILLKIFEVI